MGLIYQVPFTVPATPPVELAHAANFEEFDGLTTPTTNNTNASRFGTTYGATPRPGQQNTPLEQQTYTPGPIRGVVGKVGGQPLPVANPLYRIGRGYTPANYTQRIQSRLGVGQNNQGAAQTVQLSEITNNPPVPGDISAIIAGMA